MHIMKKVLCIVSLMMFASVAPSLALLLDLDDVDGKGYFQDQATGNIWQDVDNFFGMTLEQILTGIDGSGYHLASETELSKLLNSANKMYETNTFEVLSDIMGGGYSAVLEKDVISGLADLSGSLPDIVRCEESEGRVSCPAFPPGPSFPHDSSVTGAWVVSVNTVPEPGTIMILGMGILGLIAFKRKLKS